MADVRWTMLTRRAQALATLAHQGQVDKIGEPYIDHPTRVAEAVCGAVGDGDAVRAAFLHDVVEDTSVTLEDLSDFGFSQDLVVAVNALTKRKGESLERYYERIKTNRIATIVKWFDVADNADPRRLERLDPDIQDRLRAKYVRARYVLTEEARLAGFVDG